MVQWGCVRFADVLSIIGFLHLCAQNHKCKTSPCASILQHFRMWSACGIQYFAIGLQNDTVVWAVRAHVLSLQRFPPSLCVWGPCDGWECGVCVCVCVCVCNLVISFKVPAVWTSLFHGPLRNPGSNTGMMSWNSGERDQKTGLMRFTFSLLPQQVRCSLPLSLSVYLAVCLSLSICLSPPLSLYSRPLICSSPSSPSTRKKRNNLLWWGQHACDNIACFVALC